MQDATQVSAPAFDDLSHAQLSAIEALTQSIGREIFANLEHSQSHVWQRRWWDDRLLAWSMRDEQLKVQLFRFVDVLPMLESSDAVMEHLHEYLDKVRDKLPAALTWRWVWRGECLHAGRGGACGADWGDGFRQEVHCGRKHRPGAGAAQRERELRRAFTLDIWARRSSANRKQSSIFERIWSCWRRWLRKQRGGPLRRRLTRTTAGQSRASPVDQAVGAGQPIRCNRSGGHRTARRGRLRDLFRTARRLGHSSMSIWSRTKRRRSRSTSFVRC